MRCYKNPTRAGSVFFITMDKNSYKRSFHLINLKLKDWNVAWYLDQLEITQEKQMKERKYVKKEVLRDHICLKKQCLPHMTRNYTKTYQKKWFSFGFAPNWETGYDDLKDFVEVTCEALSDGIQLKYCRLEYHADIHLIASLCLHCDS